MRIVEAVVNSEGSVRLLESVHLRSSRRALVTILDEAPIAEGIDSALLSEAALAKDWNRPEEEEAWLQAVASIDAFAFLVDPAEDIYTPEDGEPFRDAV